MKNAESAIVREAFTACAHKRLQVLDPRTWNKLNPPPFRATDTEIAGVVWRNNVTVINGYRFGLPGSPDIMGMFRGGLFFGLECKTLKGNVSDYQLWYHGFFEGLGMRVRVVRSYQETICALESWLKALQVKS